MCDIAHDATNANYLGSPGSETITLSDFWKKEVGRKEKRSGEKVESDPLVDDGGTRQLKCMVAGCLPSVHVENFSSYESRRVQIHHGVNDVRRFSHSTHRMQGRQSLMSLDRMHRSLDDSCRNSICAHAIFCTLYRERLGCRVQRSLGERCGHTWHVVIGWSTRLVVIVTT